MFIEEHKHVVEFHHDELGSLGEGKLSFGSGRQVSGQLPLTSPIPHSDTEYSLGVVHAIADNGQSYTLHGCKVYGLTIYADYLIAGKVSDSQFQSVSIRYCDISEWFDVFLNILAHGRIDLFQDGRQRLDATFRAFFRSLSTKACATNFGDQESATPHFPSNTCANA